MQQLEDFTTHAKAALARRGIRGPAARALVEDWIDHFKSSIDYLIDSGHTQHEAIQISLAELGNPVDLAKHAASQKALATWQGRHPILSSSLCGLSLAAISLCILAVSGKILTHSANSTTPDTLSGLALATSTIPWAIGILWLIYLGRKMPSDWRGLASATLWTGLLLCTTFVVLEQQTNQSNGVFLSYGFGYPSIYTWTKIALTFAITATFWLSSFSRGTCRKTSR